MEPVPSHWPPPDAADPEARVYPLFLLPQVLVPHGLMDLVVFEPRYLQMMEDVLDGPGRIVVGAPARGESLTGTPPFHPVAGLGEIGRHDRLPDGRYRLVLYGLRRVLAQEVDSDRLYRRVRTQEAHEIPVPRERETALREELLSAIRRRERSRTPAEKEEEEGELPAQGPISLLADMLMLSMPLSHGVRLDLFAELDTEKRARAALAQDALLP